MMHVTLMVLLLGCRTAPQEKKPKVEATANEKEPPGFVCEGTADLPNGYRIDIYTYFGEPEKASHVHHAAVEVRGGRFSDAFSLFEKKKNLAGTYTFRVTLDPNLQPDAFKKFGALESDVLLKVGTSEDAAKDRAAWGGSLVGEMKALVAIADEAAAKRKEGKTDAAGWASLMKGWTRRAGEINERVLKVLEYRVLGFGGVVDSGFENITGIVMDIARSAQRGEDRNIREGRERLDIIISKYKHQYTGEPLDPKITRLELAQSARGFLNDAVTSRDDRGLVGRKRFTQAIINLNQIVSPGLRRVLLEISDSANDLFKAIDADKDVRALHEKLEARFDEVLKALPNEK